MSYLKGKEYEVIPVESFRIIRKCAGCGRKMIYFNTNCFRVNANGNLLDVWLIYQCGKCKHTYNLPIYERVRSDRLEREEYNKFLNNDPELAFEYGICTQLLRDNKVEIDSSCYNYTIRMIDTPECAHANEIRIKNPYGLNLRTDKVLAEILNIPRKKISNWEKESKIIIPHKNLKNLTTVVCQ